jgi:hypothetical protein
MLAVERGLGMIVSGAAPLPKCPVRNASAAMVGSADFRWRAEACQSRAACRSGEADAVGGHSRWLLEPPYSGQSPQEKPSVDKPASRKLPSSNFMRSILRR